MVKLATFIQVIGVDFLSDRAFTIDYTRSFLRQRLLH
jgi:hypothetical protein